MIATVSKRVSGRAASPKAKSNSTQTAGEKLLFDQIATAAYFKAQARGFEPGRETQDWLDAEAELIKKTPEPA